MNSINQMNNQNRSDFQRNRTRITESSEMSRYINIEAYDHHEEKHIFYKEMRDNMLKVFPNRHSNNFERYRVLELGAGTGLFTKYLAEIPNLEVVAVELDNECFQILKHRFENTKSVQVICEDSCTFNDSSGQFQYIFSNFSDHHIKPQNKIKYFENIKRNLELGGIFVVGDEFLKPHNPEDRNARQIALKDWHYYVIEKAEKAGEKVLANLEREALISGLEEIGDFKVTCEQYEEFLSKSGFSFKKEKIGPKNRNDIGGIYVYTIWFSN